MTDITLFDELEPPAEDTAVPPLYLVHYFGAEADPPDRNPKPPGSGVVARIAERRGNLIILEFAPPPKSPQMKPGGRKLFAKIANALFLLLLLLCAFGCVEALRF